MEMNKQQSCPLRSTGKDVLWCSVIDCLVIYVEKKNEKGSFPHTKNKPNVQQLKNVIYSCHGPLYKVEMNELVCHVDTYRNLKKQC